MLVEVSIWGSGVCRGFIPGTITVRVIKTDTVNEAVYRSIQRRTGLAFCGGPCWQGSALHRGRIVSQHYSATLGRRCRTGGWDVETEIWFSIPV